MVKLNLNLKALFRGCTHCAHAALTAGVCLAAYLAGGAGGVVVAAPAMIIWYLSREERDAEVAILDDARAAGQPKSVWTVGLAALSRAATTKDFIYPLTVATAAIIASLF